MIIHRLNIYINIVGSNNSLDQSNLHSSFHNVVNANWKLVRDVGDLKRGRDAGVGVEGFGEGVGGGGARDGV